MTSPIPPGIRPTPDGTRLLDDIHGFIGRFVAFPSPETHDAVTLWAASTHMVQYFYTLGRLAVLSAEPESGKTRVLEVLNLLVPNPMFVFSASVAAIFRSMAAMQPTLLFDEVDTIFTKRGKDSDNEDLRAMLNVGYKRGATIPRCVGPRHDVALFNVYGAVALSGIGELPDTIMSRSIIVKMKRRKGTEKVEQFRDRLVEPEGHALREQLALWALQVGPDVGQALPQLPDGIVDRAAEAWEPLIAIADAAGGDWPKRSRVAASSGVAANRVRDGSIGIELLKDLRAVWRDDRMTTADIITSLRTLPEAPWSTVDHVGLDDRRLASYLRPYGVSSKNIRINKSVYKGYTKSDLIDTWDRYLSPDQEPDALP